ncbi:hypothetical protein CHLRE_09g387250v5 [Chlamydomonas reinhardtii]|uniref:Sulfotransferase n=1 Tax=Chlamydomonas reinhardtii TaxID=3055 RepID=A8IZI4_CHLRE|nr:uncharacterized protein CHLRE_09g387250v5 [Chlamydomonas reinhardtii]PNW78676.1 hypothetical protein CHLRE_09g387250v5 [Chlamydomonas reinhardtii]|eukprot:XP_001694526.1 predicted protein [Chlamydomonas reinhardtii]
MAAATAKLLAAALLGASLLCTAVQAQEVNPSSYLASQVNEPKYTIQEVWGAHKHLNNFREIDMAAKDTFVALPREYSSTHRNPCWEQEGAFKCLPYFQILGVSKCGTTDLYNRLTEHPDMVDCTWKGPHFWDEAAYPVRVKRAPGRYDGSFPAYIGIFDKPAQKIKANPNAITGEASSNTFTAVWSHLRGRTLTKRINATLAEYLWEATPYARYIVMFRDPVTRYRSAFFYYRTKSLPKATDKEFLDRVKEDIAEWENCLSSNSKLYCLKMYTPQQLVKGMYADFLPAWLAVWPRDRFLFFRTEDYKAAPVPHITATMKFLGLRDLQESEMKSILELQAKNTQSSKYDDSTLSPELKEAYKTLQDFYRPYNQALSKAFGDDPRWLWGY